MEHSLQVVSQNGHIINPESLNYQQRQSTWQSERKKEEDKGFYPVLYIFKNDQAINQAEVLDVLRVIDNYNEPLPSLNYQQLQ